MSENKKEEGMKSEYLQEFTVRINEKRFEAYNGLISYFMSGEKTFSDFLTKATMEGALRDFLAMTKEISQKGHALGYCKDPNCGGEEEANNNSLFKIIEENLLVLEDLAGEVKKIENEITKRFQEGEDIKDIVISLEPKLNSVTKKINERMVDNKKKEKDMDDLADSLS